MKQFEPTYRAFGEQSILIEWPPKIDKNILKDIVEFKNRLKNGDIKSIVNINSTYNSILISYEHNIDNIYNAFFDLKALYLTKYSQKKGVNKLWKIPVCYHIDLASDLESFSKEKKMPIESVIELHSSQIYTIYFIGFLPGFLYLGGLNKKLHFQRKSIPNLNVKKGAVGIGGEQTGIYPQNSPGGWHVIGNSPINFFNIENDNPCFASAGDKIQFVPIDLKTYTDIKLLVDAGIYQLESEVLNG